MALKTCVGSSVPQVFFSSSFLCCLDVLLYSLSVHPIHVDFACRSYSSCFSMTVLSLFVFLFVVAVNFCAPPQPLCPLCLSPISFFSLHLRRCLCPFLFCPSLFRQLSCPHSLFLCHISRLFSVVVHGSLTHPVSFSLSFLFLHAVSPCNLSLCSLHTSCLSFYLSSPRQTVIFKHSASDSRLDFLLHHQHTR